MVTVYLHGFLKDKFGAKFILDVRSPAEAVKALSVQLLGFEETIKRGNWHVLRGPLEEYNDDGEESLRLSFGITREMHLLPELEGANNGALQIIIGAVLIVAGIMSGNPQLIAAGAGMMLGGIVAMTTKIPTPEDSQGEDQKTSFLLNGTTNNSNQGAAIPRGYGRVLTGSVLVSASITAEQLLDPEGVAYREESDWTVVLGF